jgi:threonine dehydrogenase-like Zn-dependent dehydrogenase
MSEVSKAAVMIEPGRIELDEIALPTSIPDDAGLLRVDACGVCGADWVSFSGEQNWAPLQVPLVLGHEIVGTIEALGDTAANRWGAQVGDRVVIEEAIPCGHCEFCRRGHYLICADQGYGARSTKNGNGLWGGYSQYVYMDPRAVVHRVNREVDPSIWPLFIPVSNGIYWVQEMGRATTGQTVLVQGPGQHGLGCVIGAKEAGAGQIIVAGISGVDDHRLALARELGADHIVHADDPDALVAEVEELTGGRMADVVIHVAEKAPVAFETSIRLAGQWGRIINVGLTLAPSTNVLADLIMIRQLTIIGVRGRYGASVPAALRLIEEGKYPLEKLSTHTFGVDDTSEAILTVGRQRGADAVHVTVDPWI